MILVMLKKLILSGVILVGLSGCASHVENEKTVSEVHKIYEIDNKGYIHGEKVKGTGEGIYYSVKEMKEHGIKNIKVGDKIKFTWTTEDFDNENWDEFKAKKVD
jgi:CTP-dependent riboflavin kinase